MWSSRCAKKGYDLVMAKPQRRAVPAIVVQQWLPEWDEIVFDEQSRRRRPEPFFYLFSLSAKDLRGLTGIYRRTTEGGLPRVRDFGIQRRHIEERSDEIARFVRRGYPWSTLGKQKRKSGKYDDLLKPGWLPTAIVLNILLPEDTRRGRSVHLDDVVEVETSDTGSTAEILLPKAFEADAWTPRKIGPMEVIDGQHRLWAFEADEDVSYELPVVAFRGLDLSWQAYLFYTINIKPKRINASLAYDLYPMLRNADWLERAEEHVVYKETRAQELTEALWSYPESAWYQRIDMLGERGRREVTQAAWIRSLIASFVKSWEGPGVRIGGLFGAPVGEEELVLHWNRAQQSALLMHLWQSLESSILANNDEWARALRDDEDSGDHDPAFAGRWTLSNSDQGVRGVLTVVNDLCYVRADVLRLSDWDSDSLDSGLAESAIDASIGSFKKTRGAKFIVSIAEELAGYDWRTSGAPGLSEEERQAKARFRGGTGYREIRADLLRHLAASRKKRVSEAAIEVAEMLGLD